MMQKTHSTKSKYVAQMRGKIQKVVQKVLIIQKWRTYLQKYRETARVWITYLQVFDPYKILMDYFYYL